MTSSRVLKKSASGVLASLRGSPYGTEYDSPLRSLRPTPWKRRVSARLGWAGEKVAFLNTLWGALIPFVTQAKPYFRGAEIVFQQPVRVGS